MKTKTQTVYTTIGRDRTVTITQTQFDNSEPEYSIEIQGHKGPFDKRQQLTNLPEAVNSANNYSDGL